MIFLCCSQNQLTIDVANDQCVLILGLIESGTNKDANSLSLFVAEAFREPPISQHRTDILLFATNLL